MIEVDFTSIISTLLSRYCQSFHFKKPCEIMLNIYTAGCLHTNSFLILTENLDYCLQRGSNTPKSASRTAVLRGKWYK